MSASEQRSGVSGRETPSEAGRSRETQPDGPSLNYVGLSAAEIRVIQEGLHYIGPLPDRFNDLERKLELAAGQLGKGT